MTYYTWDKAVTSSSLRHVYYDSKTANLYVEFHNGSVAGYENVLADVAYELTTASSVGQYYNRYIRGRYKGVVTDGEMAKRPLVISNSSNETVHFVPANADGVVRVSLTQNRPGAGAKVTRTYTVSGYALVAEQFEANSVEDAVEQYLEEFGEGSVVKQVAVSFE